MSDSHIDFFCNGACLIQVDPRSAARIALSSCFLAALGGGLVVVEHRHLNDDPAPRPLRSRSMDPRRGGDAARTPIAPATLGSPSPMTKSYPTAFAGAPSCSPRNGCDHRGQAGRRLSRPRRHLERRLVDVTHRAPVTCRRFTGPAARRMGPRSRPRKPCRLGGADPAWHGVRL